MTRVVVVGGGIAGLGAAYTLKKVGLDVTVLEAASEAGGRIRSREWNGAWVDMGAEFIADGDMQQFRPLIQELGLEDQLRPYPGGKVAFEVWRDGKPHSLSFTEMSSILRFGAMSSRGKAQLLKLIPSLAGQVRHGSVGFEPWRAAWCDDRSIEKWLGMIAPEFLEYAIEPCYSFYCGWEPGDTGRGTLVYMTLSYRQTSVETFPQGLGQLTRTLAAQLNVITGAQVSCVHMDDKPITIEYERGGRASRIEADYVVMAVPGSKVLGMMDGLDPVRELFFKGVRYTPHEAPYFQLKSRPDDVPTRVFFPRREDRNISHIGYEVSTTTPGVEFLRVTGKTPFKRALLGERDDIALDALQHEATRRFPQVESLVEDRLISRWKEGIPIFWPGYLKTLENFVNLTPLPNVTFAGDYLAGPSTGAAYVTGQRAAAQVIGHLAGATNWIARDTRDTQEFPLFKPEQEFLDELKD
jgi:protoporphyrinogen/coproporphyrinogen III oxidase